MKIILTVAVILAVTSQAAIADYCKTGDNCKPPNCRCWHDKAAPGGFKTGDIPQMVIISFEYAVNRANVDTYTDLFSGIKNPNKCSPKPTFFVQVTNTDFAIVKELYDTGYEVAVTSSTGQIPTDWNKSFNETLKRIAKSNIPVSSVKGTRGPSFHVGGNDQMKALVSNNFSYDTTCISKEYVYRNQFLWPYTYDFVDDTPDCTIGAPPTAAFPGKWQFLTPDLRWHHSQCASPSGCAQFMRNFTDAYQFIFDTFMDHYNSANRAPFVFNIDPQWLSESYRFLATQQFLQLTQVAFNDVWILSFEQALAWIQDPVPSSEAEKFVPWGC